MTLILNKWEISCNHTPDIIDRILMQLRKRNLAVNSFEYEKLSEVLARCVITFEESELNSSRIFNNMLRTIDIHQIKQL